MPEGTKTNSMRALEQRKIAYIAHYYGEDEIGVDGPAFHSAEEVAALIGLPPEQVFKTLVVMPSDGEPRPLLAIVPAHRELDLKALASAARIKKLRMAKHDEAEELTGLQVGGISALALLNKPWPVFLDSSAKGLESIAVSAGQRGINLQLAVDALVKLTKARVAPIARPPAA